MTAGNPLRRPPGDRLRFLAETVLAEVALLRIECRQLRNFMIHEYVRDMAVLASALSKGHLAVPLLDAAAQTLAGLVLPTGAAAIASDPT